VALLLWVLIGAPVVFLDEQFSGGSALGAVIANFPLGSVFAPHGAGIAAGLYVTITMTPLRNVIVEPSNLLGDMKAWLLLGAIVGTLTGTLALLFVAGRAVSGAAPTILTPSGQDSSL
jgi:hypothetical protein